MINQFSKKLRPSKNLKTIIPTYPPPTGYTCFRCGKNGHFIQNCQMIMTIKRSTGIPKSFMVPVDGPEHKGALLTSSGQYAIPLLHQQAYGEEKTETTLAVPQDKPAVVVDKSPVAQDKPTVEYKTEIPEGLPDNKSYKYSHERGNYYRRYDRQNGDSGFVNTQVSDTSPVSNHLQSDTQDIHYNDFYSNTLPYPTPEQELAEYYVPPQEEHSSHQYQEPYQFPPHPILIHQPVHETFYAPPVVPPQQPYSQQMFPLQPPPSGTFSTDTFQPPSPGIDHLLPLPTDSGQVFESFPYKGEEEVANLEERNRSPILEELQRKLDKLYRKYAKQECNRSRSKSPERRRSRSYSPSESWTGAVSRSPSRTYHSRPHKTHLSQKRKKSHTPSRSRSKEKYDSSIRSRTRTRSRSRNESRDRRRSASKEKAHSHYHRTYSRTYSTKHSDVSYHRSRPYVSKYNYNQPPSHFRGGPSYQSQFGPS